MKAKTAIIYSSVDGQTRKICERLCSLLSRHNHDVELISVHDLSVDIRLFQKIIIASSIRYGSHHVKIIKFIEKNFKQLNSMKSAFVSVNLVARKPEKAAANTNPYVIKFLNSISWKPAYIAVFAGTLNYKQYSFVDRLMIQLIMLITKGPVRGDTEIEYTDWNKVDEFAEALRQM